MAISIGKTEVLSDVRFKSGKRKGERKPVKRTVWVDPQPPSRTIVTAVHPAYVMRTGLAALPMLKIAVQTAVQVAKGAPIYAGPDMA